MKAQKTEFIVADQKYTPRAATVNGKSGRIWTRRRLVAGGWVYEGSAFVRAAAPEIEVQAEVDSALEGK